jgi:ferredoxin-NADP reductase
MRKSGDRCIQSGGAFTVRDQEAQKHSDRRGTPFRCGPSALLTSLQDELSQTLRVEPGRVLSEPFQQIAKVKAVVVKGGIAGPTLLPHPATK